MYIFISISSTYCIKLIHTTQNLLIERAHPYKRDNFTQLIENNCKKYQSCGLETDLQSLKWQMLICMVIQNIIVH